VALICFVLSKTGYENRQIVYMGKPSEVSFRDGSNIDHIVIKDPAKFYFRKNRKKVFTSLSDAELLANPGGVESFLYISGNEIDNVHFEGWYV
jgi:hypothetical protein